MWLAHFAEISMKKPRHHVKKTELARDVSPQLGASVFAGNTPHAHLARN
jgi:hypothetical protein